MKYNFGFEEEIKMNCNYFDYKDMTDRMFYGVALTSEHLTKCTEAIRQYLVDGGAGFVAGRLGIGIRTIEKQFYMSECNKHISTRFIWLKGERKGEELTINEISNIGMFLKHGAYYGRLTDDGKIS
jgi:hypothetical protein